MVRIKVVLNESPFRHSLSGDKTMRPRRAKIEKIQLNMLWNGSMVDSQNYTLLVNLIPAVNHHFTYEDPQSMVLFRLIILIVMLNKSNHRRVVFDHLRSADRASIDVIISRWSTGVSAGELVHQAPLCL